MILDYLFAVLFYLLRLSILERKMCLSPVGSVSEDQEGQEAARWGVFLICLQQARGLRIWNLKAWVPELDHHWLCDLGQVPGPCGTSLWGGGNEAAGQVGWGPSTPSRGQGTSDGVEVIALGLGPPVSNLGSATGGLGLFGPSLPLPGPRFPYL